MARADFVSIIEAVYGIELSQASWLAHVAQASADGMGVTHLGAYAITYDASDIYDCRFDGFAATPSVDRALVRILEFDFVELYRSAPQMVEAVLRRVAFGPSRKLPLDENMAVTHDKLAAFQVHQILGLNGVNVDGRGAHVGLLLRRRTASVDPAVLSRLSSHLAAASRLRRRLGDAPPLESADAVIDSNTGRVAHAVRGADVRGAREALAMAARHLAVLRGPVRRRDPEKATRQWKALVQGRWSLVDHFDSDGRRYLLAQSNEAPLAPLALLSEREVQVVALAAVGHANKMIGYELGIAVSTVGVLLGRAARKLGTRTRRDLIARYVSTSPVPLRRTS